jgi:hypothetical protein
MIDNVRVFLSRGLSAHESWDLVRARALFRLSNFRFGFR